MREIKFQNIGREKKHEVTLFELYEIPVEINGINNAQSFAERRLTFYWMQAQEYLKIKGFEDTTGYFRVIDGAVINSDTVWQPLFAAIEERDLSNGGQTGEYLAALIDHKSRMLLNAWPPTHTEYSVILNEVMLIQEYFFRLFILDEVHPQYSAGKNRTHAGNEVKNKSEFMMEAEELCRKYRSQNNFKADCYKKTASRLNEKYGEDAPKAPTIKSWFIFGQISF